MEHIKFNTKIKSFKLNKKEELKKNIKEEFKCPDILNATRYKIKPPLAEHAMYVIISNAEHENNVFPYEIFITTKDPEHQMWVQALTRVISAIFRHGGDISFLVEELKAIYDPKGGYRKKGGDWYNSIIAEVGSVIEKHLLGIKGLDNTTVSFPEEAVLCKKCHNKAVIIMDGCSTCLACGDSKCS